MKKVSLLVIALVLLATGNTYAGEVDPCADELKFLEPSPSKITSQIEDLLKERNGFMLGGVDEMSALVHFMLNNEKEIVVLSVQTHESRLESFVKARLNYEKAEDQDLQEGKVYRVPIRIRV
ncbi:MAG: hypothetical protein P8X60_05935 [Robiginitalea sp.]